MTTTTPATQTVARFTDTDGTRHRVLVRDTDTGWEVIDLATRVLDRLDARSDERAGAEAIARDFAAEHDARPGAGR
jgi:hypothetical protein